MLRIDPVALVLAEAVDAMDRYWADNRYTASFHAAAAELNKDSDNEDAVIKAGQVAGATTPFVWPDSAHKGVLGLRLLAFTEAYATVSGKSFEDAKNDVIAMQGKLQAARHKLLELWQVSCVLQHRSDDERLARDAALDELTALYEELGVSGGTTWYRMLDAHRLNCEVCGQS